MSQSIGPTLRRLWVKLSGKPFGKWLFSRMVGLMAPYSSTIGARVDVLEPGHGLVSLADRRKIRNHLGSIHAIALVNLAELVTGLTLMHSLPENMRGILVGIEMQYLKKARGRLQAECVCDVPEPGVEKEVRVVGEIRDCQGDIVAKGVATWLLGTEKS